MWKFNMTTVILHKLYSLAYTETFQWFIFNFILQNANLCTLPEEKTHITLFFWKIFQDILHLSIKTGFIEEFDREKKKVKCTNEALYLQL